MKSVNSYVGQPIERVEDLRLLRGRGQFVDDLYFDGMLHAAILRSSVPHGRLLRVDTTAATALAGVVTVVTAAEVGNPVPTIPLRLAPMAGLIPYEQPVIATGKVRYVGEPIAVVIAESAAIAEDALELITLEIEALPPCVDTRTAAANRSLLFEEVGTNLPQHTRPCSVTPPPPSLPQRLTSSASAESASIPSGTPQRPWKRAASSVCGTTRPNT